MNNQILNKLQVLMWKNWKTTTREKIATILQFAFPLICCVMIIFFRKMYPTEEQEEKHFQSYDPLEYLPSSDNNNLAYAPCNNNIGAMLNKIKNVKVTCFDTENELEETITDDQTYFAGIQFDDKYFVSPDQPLDNELFIKFRFPTALTKDGNISHWFTSNIYPETQMDGPRIRDQIHTGSPNYRDSHFLALQIMFAKAFAETTLSATDFPKILLQKYPYDKWLDDMFYDEDFIIFTIVIFCLMFGYNFLSLLESIVTEKENQLKESMKIMGLAGWMHWLGWFLQAFLITFITAFIIIMLLTQFKVDNQVVFTYSYLSIILVLFALYLTSLICFAFLLSTFFQKASTASVFGSIVLILTMLPFVLVYKTGSKSSKIGCSLFSNAGFGFGLQTLFHYEGAHIYQTWDNLFKTEKSSNLSVGVVFIILSIDSLIYLLLSLYIEALFPGNFGVSHKWYFPFTRSYWYGEKENTTEDNANKSKKNVSEFIEEAPEDLTAGIQIRNLSKNFGSNKVVKQLDLDIYDGQITVLLGHNGAGKTTTMSILTGMFSPSSGTAIVGGYDVRTNIERVRESIGLCLQHNVLFNKLTVEEHLQFFGRLKGLNNDEIKLETNTYLRLLQLENKKKEYTCTLSGGMKRKLCVAISLCGNSKIVILDEPTAGMDPAARRTVWELLQKEKKDRTILLTTHYMDEADLLGDRIAIMCDGQVKCVGSSFFLKKKYGSGYYLVMEAQPKCDANEVTNMLRRHISTVKLNSYIGSELSYLLSERELSKFEGALSDLEKNFNRLKINGYGLSLANMEEVFMKVGSDQNHIHRPEAKITLEESIKTEFNTGPFLMYNQCEAMTIKKYKSTIRNWFPFLLQLILPIIILVGILLSSNTKLLKSFPALPLSLNEYSNSTTLLSGNQSSEYYNLYKQVLSGHHIREAPNVADVMLSVTKKVPYFARKSYIVGATFYETSNTTNTSANIIAWFNGDPYHAEPLSLQLVLNTILRKSNNKTFIKITNHPLKFSAKAAEKHIKQGSSIVNCMAMVLVILVGYFAMFPVKERITRSKHLQIVSGVHIAMYWGLAYFWDMMIFMVNIITIIVVLVIMRPGGFNTFEEFARLFLLLMCFGLSFLPLVYLISKIVKNEAVGFSNVMMISMICTMAFIFSQLFNAKKYKLVEIPEQICLIIVPFYNIIHGINKLYIIHSIKTNVAKNYFTMSFDLGIGLHVLCLFATAVIYFVLLLLTEHNDLQKMLNLFSPKKPKSRNDLEEDVVKENNTIRTTSKTVLNKNYTLVLKDVTKYYKKFLAVNNLCLGVKPYECFGLLGINGAGKTTTFQMMTGDEAMTSGEAWVNGFSVNKELRKVHKSLGYCPQFDALLPDLTARETLLIFALIRGVPHKDCHELGENLAIEFDFFQHLDKRTKQLSGGNKRKLSTALALIGNPMIVFLDEPTAGMDPATRRFLWQVLCKVRDSGKTIILTSHSMEECEALCTRLAIMVNGKFECIGSSQRLKNKFAQGYTLTIKLKKHKNVEKLQKEVEEVEKFVKYQFTGATLQERHMQLMTFLIPSTSIPCSAIFGILESSKKSLNIEDYAVGQSSLEQVFLSFIKLQK